MYVVTEDKGNDEKLGIQKILHPLTKEKGKIMSKIYKIPGKFLIPIHKPQMPAYEYEIKEASTDLKSRPANINQSHWSPIDYRFFTEDTSDDDEPTIKPNTQRLVESEFDIQAEDLEWDNSVENIQLGHTPTTQEDQYYDAIQPRQLFKGNDESTSSNLTELSSDDEVFVGHRKLKTTKLQRRNAIRKPRNITRSEPRVTRDMLRSDRYSSASNPTTPSQVILDKTQNLDKVLRPRSPLVPDTVNMNAGAVQTLSNALNNINDNENQEVTRPRRRQRIDYVQLHKYGTKRQTKL